MFSEKIEQSPVAGWEPLSRTWGKSYLGWFRKSSVSQVGEDSYQYIEIYKFWLEPFSKKIRITPENVHWGILHYGFMPNEVKEEISSLPSGEDLSDLLNIRLGGTLRDIKSVSIYCEHVPETTIIIDQKNIKKMTADEVELLGKYRLQVKRDIERLPKYLNILDQTIKGNISTERAEALSVGVLSSKVL